MHTDSADKQDFRSVLEGKKIFPQYSLHQKKETHPRKSYGLRNASKIIFILQNLRQDLGTLIRYTIFFTNFQLNCTSKYFIINKKDWGLGPHRKPHC